MGEIALGVVIEKLSQDGITVRDGDIFGNEQIEDLFSQANISDGDQTAFLWAALEIVKRNACPEEPVAMNSCDYEIDDDASEGDDVVVDDPAPTEVATASADVEVAAEVPQADEEVEPSSSDEASNDSMESDASPAMEEVANTQSSQAESDAECATSFPDECAGCGSASASEAHSPVSDEVEEASCSSQDTESVDQAGVTTETATELMSLMAECSEEKSLPPTFLFDGFNADCRADDSSAEESVTSEDPQAEGDDVVVDDPAPTEVDAENPDSEGEALVVEAVVPDDSGDRAVITASQYPPGISDSAPEASCGDPPEFEDQEDPPDANTSCVEETGEDVVAEGEGSQACEGLSPQADGVPDVSGPSDTMPPTETVDDSRDSSPPTDETPEEEAPQAVDSEHLPPE